MGAGFGAMNMNLVLDILILRCLLSIHAKMSKKQLTIGEERNSVQARDKHLNLKSMKTEIPVEL